MQRFWNGLPGASLVVSVLVFTLSGATCSVHAQTTSTAPAFEVATIKPFDMATFNGTHFWVHVNQARSSYWAMNVKSLFSYAYRIDPFQVTGPGSIDADSYDIEARFPKGTTKEDEPKMLQALLKERFKLTFHIEKKELESYALVVGKHGTKLKASLPDPPKSDPDAPLKPGESYVGEGDAKSKMTVNPDGSRTTMMNGRTSTFKFDMETWSNHLEDSKMTMAELADVWSRFRGRRLLLREGSPVGELFPLRSCSWQV